MNSSKYAALVWSRRPGKNAGVRDSPARRLARTFDAGHAAVIVVAYEVAGEVRWSSFLVLWSC
jgi:hypothetical protein